jgi:predicted nucleotide-binding protein
MPDLTAELNQIATRAKAIHAKCSSKSIKKAIEQLIAATNEVELSHSGSWLGYHSLVYYENLESPPRGAFFDRQWGLMGRYSSATSGDWVKYNYSDIFELLKSTKTKPSFEELVELSNEIAGEVDDLREDLISVIEACRAAGSDEYLDRSRDDAKKARQVPAQNFAKSMAIPPPPFTNDRTAAAGGVPVPPHAEFRASVYSVRSLFDSAEDLAKIAKRTATYLSNRMTAKVMLRKNQGSRVFIGHGRSSAWLELKIYVQDKLGLPCDDFNRQATAGITTVSRLSTMLGDAGFAFLVLTAEDEQKDDRMHARQNVVHEAGLFQGKLGFEKAIVMLENGCEEFSNIHGLGQIRFDKGKISGCFHEVSDTLKREGVIS